MFRAVVQGPLPLYKIAPSLVFTQSRGGAKQKENQNSQKKDTHKQKGGRCKACASEEGGGRTGEGEAQATNGQHNNEDGEAHAQKKDDAR